MLLSIEKKTETKTKSVKLLTLKPHGFCVKGGGGHGRNTIDACFKLTPIVGLLAAPLHLATFIIITGP